MAIDTRNKRSSVQAYYLGMMRPLADATINAGDRATLGWIYAGLAYSGVAPPASTRHTTGRIVQVGRLMGR